MAETGSIHSLLARWKLPQQLEPLIIVIQRGFAAFAALLRFGTEIFLPDVRRVLAFAAVRGNARADAADNGRVDGGSRHNHLSLRERGQVIQQVAAHALDGRRHALLVDLVDDAHDALRLALAQHVRVQLARSLADQANSYTKFAPLGQHLLEDGGGDDLGATRREVMRLL